MKRQDDKRKAGAFTPEELERIKETLFRMFEENRVAVVDSYNGELKAHSILAYTLRRTGLK